jgi:hypothetical protein
VRLGTLRTLGRAWLDVVADVLPQPQLDVDRAGPRCSVVGVLLLDDLDRQVLTALVLAPKRQLQLVREVEVSSLTIKRRAGLLIGRGLVKQDAARQPFVITPAGLAVPPSTTLSS